VLHLALGLVGCDDDDDVTDDDDDDESRTMTSILSNF
jgi:hypothetical protein